MKKIFAVIAVISLMFCTTGCAVVESFIDGFIDGIGETTVTTQPTTTKTTNTSPKTQTSNTSSISQQDTFSLDLIPPFQYSTPYVIINDNEPSFSQKVTGSFEKYYDLDKLGRCTMAYACLGRDLMPTTARGSISSIRPTGWHSSRYTFVEENSLYNRCHLIGWQLSGENANPKNLITGTRFLNNVGMLPFENLIADYIKETNNHVLYRVTPIYDGDNLVASGVHMEGYSVEDKGDGVCFNVYCYNAQPGVIIDYKTGDNHEDPNIKGVVTTYILNTNSHKFHDTDCPGINDIKDSNKATYVGTREILVAQGYSPCSTCKP